MDPRLVGAGLAEGLDLFSRPAVLVSRANAVHAGRNPVDASGFSRFERADWEDTHIPP